MIYSMDLEKTVLKVSYSILTNGQKFQYFLMREIFSVMTLKFTILFLS